MTINENFYTFQCGCRFKQANDTIKNYDGLPPLSIDYNNIRKDCPKTWELISSGYTRGIFQIESNTGRSYAKKLEPSNMELLSALISIIRPGTLGAILEGKSMTTHFIERRHNREPVTYLDDRLEQYAKETYGILVYQEQAISIAKAIAGFTPEQANALRKAIGKKKADELASLKSIFIEGCQTVGGLDKSVAEALFENIEASNRYSFNKSHAMSYAYISYMTSYVKAHFPLHFACASLKFIKDFDELRDLTSEFKLFDIELLGPSIENPLSRFNIIDSRIQYGLAEVKKCGIKAIDEFLNYAVEQEKVLNKPVSEFTWYEFLILLSTEVKSDSMANLIVSGVLDHTGVSRKTQLHEYNVFSSLSGGDMKWVKENWNCFDNLQALLDVYLHEGAEKRRISKINSLLSSLRNPGCSLEDDIDYICDSETEMLGVSVSRSKTANKARMANIKCIDFLLGKGSKNLTFVVEIKDVDERIIKSGPNINKKMANLKVADDSGEFEITVFSKEWTEMKKDLVKRNVVLLQGSRNQDMSFRVENVTVI